MKLLQISVLLLILGQLIILLHIDRNNDNMKFMYQWNIVKTLRSNNLEQRIQKLEKK